MKPSTGTAYKQATYPQAMLFQTIVKAHVRGTEVLEDTKEMFDPSTGKTYVPFASAIKVNTTTQLMYCVHTFVTSMTTLKKEAPRVYFEFVRDVARVADDKGAKFAQEYVDLILLGVCVTVYCLMKLRASSVKGKYTSSKEGDKTKA